eukprot:TRINITY_DN5602_c0_g1_i2.p1 TRINITY_DN5602_c0_g1~~TRINITY_DN5602_c0_g1_i2.p1  ORF type:complete len:223 (+),score=15.78 TRINITY_DN5602_c0_g1_i2:68-736(+)
MCIRDRYMGPLLCVSSSRLPCVPNPSVQSRHCLYHLAIKIVSTVPATTIVLNSGLKSVMEKSRSQETLQERNYSNKIRRLHCNYSKLIRKPRNAPVNLFLTNNKSSNIIKSHKHLHGKEAFGSTLKLAADNCVEGNSIKLYANIKGQLQDSLPKLKVSRAIQGLSERNRGVNNGSVARKLNMIIRRNQEIHLQVQRDAIIDVLKLKKINFLKKLNKRVVADW